jgi:hypothetical protein
VPASRCPVRRAASELIGRGALPLWTELRRSAEQEQPVTAIRRTLWAAQQQAEEVGPEAVAEEAVAEEAVLALPAAAR